MLAYATFKGGECREVKSGNFMASVLRCAEPVLLGFQDLETTGCLV